MTTKKQAYEKLKQRKEFQAHVLAISNMSAYVRKVVKKIIEEALV